VRDEMHSGDVESETTESAGPRPRRSRTGTSRRHERAPKRAPRWPIALVALIALGALGWGAWAVFRPKDTSTPVLASPPSAGRTAAKTNPELVAGVNDFGFELLRRGLDANTASSSFVLSPISVHSMLAMAECGAVGSTSERMRQVLGVDSLKPPTARQAYADLLVNVASSQRNHLVIANSVWVDDTNSLKQSFLDTDRLYFGAEARSVDLQSPPGVNEINWWVSKNTGDRIVRVLGEPMPSTTSIELFDAAYFLGNWKTQFDPHSTKRVDFHVANGPAVKTNIMHITGGFEYSKNKSFEAIRLPYKDVGASAIVILPSKSSSLERVLPSLKAKRLAQIRGDLKSAQGSFGMPTLDSRALVDLREPLSAMGLGDIFSSSRADFSAMVNKPPAWIDRVRHSTYLHVDEHGTEAAVASAMQPSAKATASGKPFEMIADRPYVIVIVDDRTGAMLFLAAVRDPRG
jgi:serine protease inhibitor